MQPSFSFLLSRTIDITKVIIPILPINIKTIRITLPIGLNKEVIPMDKPTVASALVHSNRIAIKSKGSKHKSRNTLINNVHKFNVKIVVAWTIISLEICR